MSTQRAQIRGPEYVNQVMLTCTRDDCDWQQISIKQLASQTAERHDASHATEARE